MCFTRSLRYASLHCKLVLKVVSKASHQLARKGSAAIMKENKVEIILNTVKELKLKSGFKIFKF